MPMIKKVVRVIKKIENVTGKRKNKTTKIMSIAPPEL